MKQTKVVFRTYKDTGDLIAVLPYIIVGKFGDCLAYSHTEGIISVEYLHVMSKTVRSTPDQVREMSETLKSVGHENIIEIKRINAKESQKANEEFRLKR